MAPAPKAQQAYYALSTLQKGLCILELLAEHGPCSVSQVARHLEQNRSASHRFLATMRDLGYVYQDEHSRYGLTLKIYGLGSKVWRELDLPRMALPVMRRLADAHLETINLGCLENGEVVVVQTLRSQLPLCYDLPAGSRGPAHALALGKALLAFGPPKQRDAYLSGNLRAPTQHTITRTNELEKELTQVRQAGYALDDQECVQGIRCLAAPILDHQGSATYALSVSGPTQRMNAQRGARVLPDLMNSVRALSRMLGGSDFVGVHEEKTPSPEALLKWWD